MELKHFSKNGDNYELINPAAKTRRKGFIIVLVLLLGSVGLSYILNSNVDPNAIIMLAVLSAAILVIASATAPGIVYINVDERVLIVKRKRNEKRYSFDQFLNFQKTRRVMNGIATIGFIASIYFDDNGKNVLVSLGSVKDERTADEIISEADTLLNR